MVARADYQAQKRVRGDAQETLPLPPSNVLAFELDGGSRVIARPSGTEPKIKLYIDVRQIIAADEKVEDAQARAQLLLHRVREDFVTCVDGASTKAGQ